MRFRRLGQVRPQGLGDLLRQLADPRLAGRGGRRARLRPNRPSRPASPPSTRPTSTPTPRPRRCSARRWPASAASRWRSSPRSTAPTGPGGPNDSRSVPQAHPARRSTDRCGGCRPTTSTSTRPTATTTRRRWKRRCRPSPTSCIRQGALHRRLGVDRRADPRRLTPSRPSCKIPFVSNQPQYSHALAGHRGRGRPDLRGARHRPGRLVTDRPRRADRQVQAWPGAAGRFAGHRRRRAGRDMIRHWLSDEVLDRRREARADRGRGRPVAWPSSRSPGCCRTRTSPARSSAPRGPSRSADNVGGRRGDARRRTAEGDRRRRSPTSLTTDPAQHRAASLRQTRPEGVD